MAGNTGRLTSSQIRQRGPRLRLLRCYKGIHALGFVIMREPDAPAGLACSITLEKHWYRVYAKSYSLGYLLNLVRKQAAP